MYGASTGFVDALRWGSTLAAARITVLTNGVSTGITLPVSDASFTVNRNSAQRRQGSVTVEVLPTVPPQTVDVNGTPQYLLPLTTSAPLAPFGNEIFVEITVESAGGSTSYPALYGTARYGSSAYGVTAPNAPGSNGWVPLGTYAIVSSDIEDSGIDLVLTLDLYDRSWVFGRWALLQNYSVPQSDSSLRGEVVALLEYVWNHNGPGAQGQPVPAWLASPNFQTVSAPWVCPTGTYQQGQDPWQACLDMAAAAGFELFFDVNGILTGKPVPGSPAGGSLSSQPVSWNFYPNEVSALGEFQHPIGGSPYSTPAAVTLKMTRDNVDNYEAVSASGPNNATGGATPVQATASDTNTSSPTYTGGGLGIVPNFVYDSQITSSAQALAEAEYDLGVSLASAFTLSVDTPPNPLFDIDDVVTVTNPRLNLSAQKFIVDEISTSIRYDTVTTLSGRVVTPGS